ncbi:MAG: 2-oxo acid dehydrogenase subunit E2, partial [Anaerolineae bacterium]|nr:2-oxo acid dehydrogenase subunit E2 [Anaerolineae bacterium]
RGSGPAGRVTKQDVLTHTPGRPVPSPAAPLPAAAGPRSTFISPVVARLVGQHNINIAYVPGTGKDGRVTKKDIEIYVAAGKPVPAAAPPPAPIAAPAAAPAPPVISTVEPGSLLKFTPVRKSIAKHMVHSKHTSPHVTTVMEVDMSRVWAHRAANKHAFNAQGVNLTFTVYFMAATTAALQAYPIVNSSWTDEGIAVHQHINIGMATSLGEDGLIVPVLKGMAGLSLFDIAHAVNDLAERARSKKLVPDEVQGGTFTITNHGTSGSLFASPIINQPQAAILGTGMIQKRAVVINDAIAIRPMVYLGLTIDHRILDGAIADYFLGHIKHSLESWA